MGYSIDGRAMQGDDQCGPRLGFRECEFWGSDTLAHVANSIDEIVWDTLSLRLQTLPGIGQDSVRASPFLSLESCGEKAGDAFGTCGRRFLLSSLPRTGQSTRIVLTKEEDCVMCPYLEKGRWLGRAIGDERWV